jgi:DNA polymerase
MSLDREGLEGLWDELSLVEDWMWGGIRRDRSKPDFAAIAASRAAAEAAAAARGGPSPHASLDGGAGSRAGPRLDAMPASVPAGDRARFLATLSREAGLCQACRLHAGRKKVVFGTGVECPAVLVLGEGPGAEEDAQGLPFVGPAGQLLDKMLAAIGVSRGTNAYIANVVKCRPPSNRDPAPDEVKACSAWLERQVEILSPRVILCLGRTALQALTGEAEGITRLHGRWFEYRGIPLIGTFHPSAILRDEACKRPAWEDLKLLRDKLGDVLLP